MKWVLIDLSCLAYKAMYTVGDLAAEDIPTGVLYGFFEQLYALCESPSIKSNKVLIFTDSKKSYRRRTFPEYKQKRKQNKTPEELAQIKIMYEQIDKLKNKILPGLGIPVYKQVGLESDDLLAQASKYFTEKKEETIIITSDGDLYQCLTPYVNWYDPGRELFMDAKKLKETKGVNPKQWGLVKAMAGCTSDNVPGLPGVGEKTAVKYIMGELPDSHKTYETITSEEGQRDIKKWKRLVVLPHKKTKPFVPEEPKYNSEAFFEFCEKYDIVSYLEEGKKKKWMDLFKGEFKRTLKKIKRRKKLI